MKYIAKERRIIEAERFLPPNQIPKGVINVYSSPDEKTYSGQVWTIQGQRVNVKPGEWIVQEKDNPERYYPIAHEVFVNTYMPLDETTVDYSKSFIKEIEQERFKRAQMGKKK